jgi:dTDP-glucose 4,6-dehydratase
VLRHVLETTDWEIVALDSFRHRGKTDRIRQQLEGEDAARVSVFAHDLRVPISPQLDVNMGKVDFVLDLASESHVDRSIEQPREFVENNVAVTLTMLEWLRQRRPGVSKFIHISTDEVYGPAPEGYRHEEGEPHRPSNPYSASKSAQESLCFSYWRTYGLPIIITNTMNLVGEMQDPEKMVPKIIKSVLAGEVMELHGDPKTGKTGSRFYLHARNQADALVWLIDNIKPLHHAADARADLLRFNVVGERELTNQEIFNIVAAHTGWLSGRAVPESKIVDFHSSRPGHDLRYALNGDLIGTLGWKPPVPLEASLLKTVEWTLTHSEWLR